MDKLMTQKSKHVKKLEQKQSAFESKLLKETKEEMEQLAGEEKLKV